MHNITRGVTTYRVKKVVEYEGGWFVVTLTQEFFMTTQNYEKVRELEFQTKEKYEVDDLVELGVTIHKKES